MVTPEGGYVVAQPDSASWQRHVSKPKVLTEADIRERVPSDPELVCPIDNKLFREAMKTPCCGTVYCEECIETRLQEQGFDCPHCSNKIPSLDKLIHDKPMRARVKDYIIKEIKAGKTEDTKPSTAGQQGDANATFDQIDQEYYDQVDFDMSQVVAESIPQIQAQLQQISVMLNNPHLPPQVRQQTEMKHHQLQMELQQAQMAATLIQATTAAAIQTLQQQQQQQQQAMFPMQPPPMPQQQWTNPFPNQQPAGQESAYQRLPLNNRRRNLKRERPSDFLEVGGSEQDAKVPRYWE